MQTTGRCHPFSDGGVDLVPKLQNDTPAGKQQIIVRNSVDVTSEIQRVVLLIGMAATAYLLILAWNEDMEAAKVPTVYSDAPLMVQEEPVAALNAVEADEFASENSDIPPATPSDSFVVSEPEDLSSRLVKVETPALLVWIDLKGGDIVRVQLPTYPGHWKNPIRRFY